MKPIHAFGSGLAVLSALLGSAVAEDARLSIVVPAGHGQQALAVRAEGEGVRVRVCAASACSADGGVMLPLPEDVRKLLGGARGREVELASGKRVLWIDVPASRAEPLAGSWVMLIAAPLAGKGAEPLIVWSGWTGIPKGEHGEERVSVALDEPVAGGKGRRILVGERWGDVTLCGRPALVGAKELDAATLELTRGAAVQNLGEASRAAAKKIIAERVSAERKPEVFRLLRATAASSAVDRKFGTLTDGDPETSWSENKAFEGAGEFVSIASAAEVGIQGFEITVRPGAEIPGGAAPKTFYLATLDQLFLVTMPEDAWKQPPGTRYAVKLPAELSTACVAVVLGDAYATRPRAVGEGKEAKLPQVTLAEIEARTAFDGQSLAGLVGALAGGGERARASAALLSRGGVAAMQAAIAGYEALDDAGKQLARGIIDAAPCSEQVPFFAAQFAASTAPGRPRAAPGEQEPELAHARDRLHRCGRAAAPALIGLVKAGAGGAGVEDAKAGPAAKGSRTWLLAADELALLAPAEAVPVILDVLGKADERSRRELRASLARAAKIPRAALTLKDEVAIERFRARPEVVQIDLLRAIGPALSRIDGAAQAFAALAVPGASFRTRYLLQAPAAELARAGDAPAEAFLRASLRSETDAHVRTRAAEVAAKVPALSSDLVQAVNDGEVRVREAAINALAEALPAAGGAVFPGLSAALGRRLESDDWTFIRAGAARALGALPAEATVDRALAAALKDPSPEVRGRVLSALGAHKATAHADAVRAIAASAEENVAVRAQAMLALAAMCDSRSLDTWTKLAQRAKAPVNEADRRLGSAAIAALGAVHPRDIGERLGPLLQKDTPLAVREMARVAVAAKGQCR
jgi:hypothetical protein